MRGGLGRRFRTRTAVARCNCKLAMLKRYDVDLLRQQCPELDEMMHAMETMSAGITPMRTAGHSSDDSDSETLFAGPGGAPSTQVCVHGVQLQSLWIIPTAAVHHTTPLGVSNSSTLTHPGAPPPPAARPCREGGRRHRGAGRAAGRGGGRADGTARGDRGGARFAAAAAVWFGSSFRA